MIVHALRVNNKFKLKLQISALNKEYDNIITLLENKSKNQFLSRLTFSLENSKGKMTRMASTYMLYGRVTEIEAEMMGFDTY